MLNITFKGNPMTVLGEQFKVGDKAPNFTVVKNDLSPICLEDLEGIKVISVVPSIDTGICSVQTKTFNKEISAYKGVTLMTISLDLPFAQARWCGAENLENSLTVSDYQNRDFASKYNMLIEQLKLLTRAVFVLDKDNIIKYVAYSTEIAEEPDYTSALNVVKNLL